MPSRWRIFSLFVRIPLQKVAFAFIQQSNHRVLTTLTLWTFLIDWIIIGLEKKETIFLLIHSQTEDVNVTYRWSKKKHIMESKSGCSSLDNVHETHQCFPHLQKCDSQASSCSSLVLNIYKNPLNGIPNNAYQTNTGSVDILASANPQKDGTCSAVWVKRTKYIWFDWISKILS